MIFISHTEKDHASADALAAFLAESIAVPAEAIKTTGDATTAEGGCSPRELRASINDSDVILALIPPESLRSNWVIFELGAAWAMDKLLFLFFMPGIDFRDLPEPLSNYPSVDVEDPHAHITIVDMARDIADFLGLAERKNGNVLPAIERLLETMRDSGEPSHEQEHDDDHFSSPVEAGGVVGLLDKLDKLGKNPPQRLTFPQKELLSNGREYCEIEFCYDVTTHGRTQSEGTKIRAAWDDLFKAIATHLNQPRDDDYIKKLIFELAREKNATFGENCRCGLYRKVEIKSASYGQIIRRFSGLGFIETTRAPHSVFERNTGRTFWQITARGEEYLRNTLVVRKSLQEWVYKQKHIPRSTYRDREPGPRYQ